MTAADLPEASGLRADMWWIISCDLVLSVIERAEIVIQVVAARSAGVVTSEQLDIVHEGESVCSVAEILAPDGARMQIARAGQGSLNVRYRAEVHSGAPLGSIEVAQAGDQEEEFAHLSFDRQVLLRPSRYCPSDHLVGFAVAEFGTGGDVSTRVANITEWIRHRIDYVPGSSTVHDSAEDTLLTGAGTCRDFAHLGIALSRATGVPARFAAVYAPGLSPMDFHAVFETFEEGQWCVHDATGLAPRQSLVRVVTGRDAADTAFISITSGVVDLNSLEVSATVYPSFPFDDHRAIVILA